MTPQEYCQDKAARSGSSFYYSFLSLPDNKRQAITAVYAYCREVDDIVDSHADPQIKQVKLNWWREEITRLYSQTPQHPITRALAPVIDAFHLPEEYFMEILDGMEMDLTATTYATFKDLNLYCYRVASVVGLISAEIFGYQDRQTLKYAHDLGIAFQLTNIIRDVYTDLQQDRVYLPQDELQAHGITTDDLRKRDCTPQLLAFMRFQIQRADSYYNSAFAQLPESDRFEQRTGIIMAAIYHTLLKKIEQDICRVFARRVSLTPVRKLWIAWRTNRRETRQHRIRTRQQDHASI